MGYSRAGTRYRGRAVFGSLLLMAKREIEASEGIDARFDGVHHVSLTVTDLEASTGREATG